MRFGVVVLVATLCLLAFVAERASACSCQGTCGQCSTPSVASGAAACSEDLMTLTSNLIQVNEGCWLGCYDDSMGIPTIGVGYNMNADSANIASYGYSISALENCSQCLSNGAVSSILQATMQSAVSCAQGLLSNWDSLPVTAQAVAIDMSFNLGCGGFGSFVNTIAAINSQNWSGAVSGMQNSLWCSQVGNRCSRDANLMSASAQCGSGSSSSNPPSDDEGNETDGDGYTTEGDAGTDSDDDSSWFSDFMSLPVDQQTAENQANSSRTATIVLATVLPALGAALLVAAVIAAVVFIRQRRLRLAMMHNNSVDGGAPMNETLIVRTE